MILKRGDIFLLKSHSLLGDFIRLGTTSIGESFSEVNHVGLIVEEGPLKNVLTVEALCTVKRHNFFNLYGDNPKKEIAIYRPINLTFDEINSIVYFANTQVGKHYGYFKLALHFADWCLDGAYVFRRLAFMGDYPICSWLVAYAFSSVGKHFGVEPNAASPDDIWDFVTTHNKVYECVHELGILV